MNRKWLVWLTMVVLTVPVAVASDGYREHELALVCINVTWTDKAVSDMADDYKGLLYSSALTTIGYRILPPPKKNMMGNGLGAGNAFGKNSHWQVWLVKSGQPIGNGQFTFGPLEDLPSEEASLASFLGKAFGVFGEARFEVRIFLVRNTLVVVGPLGREFTAIRRDDGNLARKVDLIASVGSWANWTLWQYCLDGQSVWIDPSSRAMLTKALMDQNTGLLYLVEFYRH